MSPAVQAPMERYRALADYGLLGDGRTAALVTCDGSLDWWCAPRFDSPAVFARLLDAQRGGCFAVSPPDRALAQAQYEEGTNVLRHRFVAGTTGEAVLTDALVWRPPEDAPGSVLVRVAEGVRGEVPLHVRFAPRPGFGLGSADLHVDGGSALASWDEGALGLETTLPLRAEGADALAEVTLREGERHAFVLTCLAEPEDLPLPAARAPGLLEDTRRAWREWDARTTYDGPYREQVRRSALILRMLRHDPTGAVVAAPTTSLPERIRGVRNWDYRYAWVRDAAFVVEALQEVGHPRYASEFVRWVCRAAERTAPDLRVMYGVGGEVELPERELPLEGWRHSRPVRVGNAASQQHQLDIYGELLLSVHARHKAGTPPRTATRAVLGRFVDRVAERWREPDQGIWEMRSEPRHFVLSKAMAWVALDRGLALGLPGDHERWRAERDACRALTLEQGWSDELGAFQMAFGYPHLDAANLMLPLIGFLDARDRRMVATVERTMERLAFDGLVYRYLDADDGLPGGEAAFTYCTFWLVDNLTLQGRLDEARALYERALARASPLGLLAEEVHPGTGELLGNYPQAFSHIGVLKSAVLLARAARGEAVEVRR
jgi:GH15 family glucan-1,4-alpha-glucosidase